MRKNLLLSNLSRNENIRISAVWIYWLVCRFYVKGKNVQQQPTKRNAGILFHTLVRYQHKYVDFIFLVRGSTYFHSLYRITLKYDTFM